MTEEQFIQYVIQLLAQFKCGQLAGLSVSAVEWGQSATGAAYLSSGVDKLDMLDTQVRLLDD